MSKTNFVNPAEGSGDTTAGKPAILFVNHSVENCGIYQYGRNLFRALSLSDRFVVDYLAVNDVADVDRAMMSWPYKAAIVNFHPSTFPSMLGRRRYRQPVLAIMHQFTQADADSIEPGVFQYFAIGDPSLVENNPRVFKYGRILPEFENHEPPPKIPTIGSFGFAGRNKGFNSLVQRVQEEFDEAIIRLHIPSNGFIDDDGSQARKVVQQCRRLITKPGIRLEVNHAFVSQRELLKFLSRNSINILMYRYVEHDGISSAADLAIASGRPLGISRSLLFRHLTDLQPPITLEDASIRQIISYGDEVFRDLRHRWTASAVCRELDAILDVVVREELNPNASGLTTKRRPNTDEKIGLTWKSVHSQLQRVKHKVKLHLDAASGLVREKQKSVVRKERLNTIVDTSPDQIDHTLSEAVDKLVGKLLTAFETPRIRIVDEQTYFLHPRTQGDVDIFVHTGFWRVENDSGLAAEIATALAPGGVAAFVCQFNAAARDNPLEGRLYTARDVLDRLLPQISDCFLVDSADWFHDHPGRAQNSRRFGFVVVEKLQRGRTANIAALLENGLKRRPVHTKDPVVSSSAANKEEPSAFLQKAEE